MSLAVWLSLGPVARGNKTYARQEWWEASDLFNFMFDGNKREMTRGSVLHFFLVRRFANPHDTIIY